MAGGFPSQRASNAESISMPWCQHDKGPVHKGILPGRAGNLQSDLWIVAIVHTIWSVILNNIVCSIVMKSKLLTGERIFEKIVFHVAVSTVNRYVICRPKWWPRSVFIAEGHLKGKFLFLYIQRNKMFLAVKDNRHHVVLHIGLISHISLTANGLVRWLFPF